MSGHHQARLFVGDKAELIPEPSAGSVWVESVEVPTSYTDDFALELSGVVWIAGTSNQRVAGTNTVQLVSEGSFLSIAGGGSRTQFDKKIKDVKYISIAGATKEVEMTVETDGESGKSTVKASPEVSVNVEGGYEGQLGGGVVPASEKVTGKVEGAIKWQKGPTETRTTNDKTVTTTKFTITIYDPEKARDITAGP